MNQAISETITRLATELESLSVTHIGTGSIQHPDLYRIACELRELAKNTAIPETSEKSSPKEQLCIAQMTDGVNIHASERETNTNAKGN